MGFVIALVILSCGEQEYRGLGLLVTQRGQRQNWDAPGERHVALNFPWASPHIPDAL